MGQFVNDLHSHPKCCNIIHQLLQFIMKHMLVVESKGVYDRANCEQVDNELSGLYKRLREHGEDRLVPMPWEPTKAWVPEAVEMPLNFEAKRVVASEGRFSQLPEHTGHTTRLIDRKRRHEETEQRSLSPSRTF
jgi:hypothetical protein